MNSLKGYVLKKDIRLYLFCNKNLNGPILDKIMYIFTKAFDTVTIFAVTCVIYGLSLKAKHPFGKHLALLLFSSVFFTHAVKRIVNRRRPFLSVKGALFRLVPPKDVYSFPSGHTCAAFSYALVMCMYFPLGKILWIFLAGLVGMSRIYLGYHYPSDVFIGALVPVFMKSVLILAGVF